MFAGNFFPISPSKKGNILIVVDMSPTSKEHLMHISKVYSLVLIIDHHTSFEHCLHILKE